jgi:fatty acid desaturase
MNRDHTPSLMMKRNKPMSLDRTVLAFAGFMTLLSVALTYWVSPYFVWLTVFVGANLLQSAFTGFCPAARIFSMFGVKPGKAF